MMVTEIKRQFDINRVLHNVYLKLQKENASHRNELVYFMNKTVPRFFEGDAEAYEKLLYEMLRTLFMLFSDTEVLMNIDAPEVFVFKENVRFEVSNLPVVSKKTLEVALRDIEEKAKRLEGTLTIDERMNVHLSLPMQTAKMGERRFYRLPSKSLLGKRVLLLMHNSLTLMSIARMFKYFPYDLDIGIGGYHPEKHRLHKYDMIVVEKAYFTPKLFNAILEARKEKDVKLVVLGDSDLGLNQNVVTAYMSKPITQSTIFDLIVSIFTRDEEEKKKLTAGEKRDTYTEEIEALKKEFGIVLDKEEGRSHAKRLGVGYNTLLENFLDEFEDSDLYFRDLIMKEKYGEVMEFLHSLKMSSKMIGAHDMQVWIKMFETTWEHKRKDLLPTYPGKYHIELERLIEEIERYLYGRSYRSL
jgi:HPt (histidine-containing phosphotransfer) domain-containing protein